MVRETATTLSSIALLQERFRQLQKMKELRQEKELLMIRMLSSESHERISYLTSPPPAALSDEHQPCMKTCSPSGLMFLPPPDPRHSQLSLSLSPDHSQITRRAEYSTRLSETPLNDHKIFKSRGFIDPSVRPPIKIHQCSNSDHVDTSLRL